MKSTFAIAAALATLLSGPAAFAQAPTTAASAKPAATAAAAPHAESPGLGKESTSCEARFKAAYPKGAAASVQQAYVSQCIRGDVKTQNSGPEGAKRQALCVTGYRKAHPDLKDRSTAGQQAYVSMCLKNFQGGGTFG